MASSPSVPRSRQRVPASERRDSLIEAAVHEFAQEGLHGTPVDRIARRVGVAQPYVFSLFGSKKELFMAAIERNVELVTVTFSNAADAFHPDPADADWDVLHAMGHAYVDLLHSHRDYLMLQLQSYAACGDSEIRDRVRELYARLVLHVERLATDSARRHGRPPPTAEQVDEFFRYGMWLNVAAAMGVDDLSAGCEWVRAAASGYGPK